MLLRENQSILQLLRLSQAETSRIRPLFIESEKMARLREQARFLKCCRDQGIFPNTIENIHLPQIFGHARMKSAVDYIKKFIMRKISRDIYRQNAISTKRLNNGMKKIRDEIDGEIGGEVIRVLQEVFDRSMRHHAKRLQNKLTHLMNKRRTVNDNDALDDRHSQPSSRDELVTDLTESLNEEERKLLEKGPKFAIKKAWNETAKVDIRVAFCKLAYQVRWRECAAENQESSNFPKYRGAGRMVNPPKVNNELENKLKMCYARIQHILSSVSRTEMKGNLTEDDVRTIKRLREKPIICLPSDKGGEFCVIESNKYTKAATEHLSDGTTYKKVSRMSAPTIEKKINRVWKNVSAEAGIPERIIRMFVSTNTELSRFYVLVKTHKAGPQIKIRPIVACRESPSYKISWLLSRLLSPLLNSVSAHLESSSQLMNEIKCMGTDERRKFPYPFSLDIVSLYTSVPQREAIEVMKRRIEQEKICLFGLTSNHIEALMEVILSNTYFTFEGEVYEQRAGLPMGNSISGIMAIVFMDSLERRALMHCQVGLFKKYIDDYCLFTTNREEAEIIFQTLNAQHPNITFEVEHPVNEKSLSLLDFTVTVRKDGNVFFEFFKKRAKRELFVNFMSAFPTASKINYARNEIKRIAERCTKKEDFKKHVSEFERILRRNGYDTKTIETSKCMRQRKVKKVSRSENVFYFQMPFVSDRINNKVRKVFKDYNIPVKIAHRSYTLKQILQKKEEKQNCELKNCTLNNNLCERKNCVYKMKCQRCNDFYIGSTKRKLHQRVREHLTSERSSVFRHRTVCRSAFDVSIVGVDICERGLRLREAITIQQQRPSINSKEESDELLSFIF